MSAPIRYAMAGTAAVAALTMALWPILDPPSRRGVLIAGLVAVPVQVVAFALLVRLRHRVNAFLTVWAGGTLLRMAVIGGVATVAIRSGMDGGVALLLALAGFFFGLLLLEPVYFRSAAGTTT